MVGFDLGLWLQTAGTLSFRFRVPAAIGVARRSAGGAGAPSGRGQNFFLGIFCWNEAKMGLNLASAPPPHRKEIKEIK